MHTFQDNQDRKWDLAVNVSAIKRLRDVLNVDLMQVIEGDLLQKLYSDPIMLVDVVYVLCQPQAEKAEVTDVQFGEAMGGDALELATAALVEEIIDFFPNRRDRERARTVLAKFQAAMEKAQDALDVRVESPKLQRELDRLVESVGEQSEPSPA